VIHEHGEPWGMINTGPDGFASPLKEGMLRVFIALKNPLPWPNLNTQTLGLVVSMLTIMSLRRQHNGEHHVLYVSRSPDGGMVIFWRLGLDMWLG
jgi:hypothetical protein